MRKRVWIFSLFLIFSFWLLSPKSNLLFAQRLLTQEEIACQHIDKGEIDKAIEILQNVLKINPENLNAHLYLGIALYLKKDSESAFQKLEKIEKDIDKKVDFDRPSGWERPEEVDPMVLESWIDRKGEVLFSEERKGLLYFCRGLTLKEKKDFKNAEKKFKKALKLKYDKESIQFHLFDLSIKKKDLKSASKQLAELKKISGESEIFVFLDGYLKYRKGSPGEALAVFEKIVSTNLESKKNVACLHYNSGDYQKAIEVWEEILSEKTDDKEAQINIGRAYFHLGNSEKAQEYFSRAGLKISPERYSPKNIPLTYESILRDIKLDLMCKAK